MFSGRILILQPRRLAARMLAARVARERSGEVGGEIGFQTRFETSVSESTRACFITEGILPRMLLRDRELAGISVVIFDEFHERSLTTDLGCALIAQLQAQARPDLKMIIMSATIDTGPLQDFLGSAAVIESSGRLFPIDIRYSTASSATPVWDRAAQAVRELAGTGERGDILVFMPGAYEIRRTISSIEQSLREPAKVLPLYGDLPSSRQNTVMEPCPVRKIIVATNIAETSLTIPGVRHVVDSGLAKINRYDSNRGFNTLFVEPISIDAADQRAGRAGREAAGICIRLWSRDQHAGRPLHTAPELFRVDLAETVLYLRMLGVNSDTFSWFQRPEPVSLGSAHELLMLLGALDNEGALTPLGEQMALFPMHPRLARLLIEAGARNAARLASFAAAILTERSAFSGKPEYTDAAFDVPVKSDFYAQYLLLEKIHQSGFDRAMCTRYAVNQTAARAVMQTHALFLQYCRRNGMHTRDSAEAPEAFALSLLLAYPDHFAVRKDKGTLICRLRGNRRGELAKTSTVRSAGLLVAADIRETRGKDSTVKTLLSMAAEVREEWLHEFFIDRCTTSTVQQWNATGMAVENHLQTECLGVMISDKAIDDINIGQASHLLAQVIIEKGLKLDAWDQTVQEWIERARWVGAFFPEKGIPQFGEEDRALVINEVCRGEYRYARVRNKPVLPFLRELLGFQLEHFIEETAPQTITLPSGRKLRITYKQGSPPKARAKIQDLYGMTASPKVGGGRVTVRIEILAPNMRPVQITDDLARFWQLHYPELKKQLSRRYPRHEWR